MGAILVLTPLVVSSWPAITAAVAGAATAMGFSVAGQTLAEPRASRKKTVETEIEHSEIVAEAMAPGQKIVIQKDDVSIAIGLDERGACTVCVTGTRQSDHELRAMGEEVAGRVVQQFAYHKLMTELKQRNYSIVEEQMLADQSIQVRVRL